MLRLYLYARVRILCTYCTRDRGCGKHPAFPAPSIGAEDIAQLGRIAPRGRDGVFGHRHCEPPGRANARPMTGSAKQSISPRKERIDCFVAALLAMTAQLFEIRIAIQQRRRPGLEPG